MTYWWSQQRWNQSDCSGPKNLAYQFHALHPIQALMHPACSLVALWGLADITWNHYWLTVGVCWLRLGCYFKEKAAWRLETLVTSECSEAFEFWSKIKRYRCGWLYGTHEIHTLKRWPSQCWREIPRNHKHSVGLEDALLTWVISSGYAVASVAKSVSDIFGK